MPTYNLRELKAAAADHFAIRSGVNIPTPHPLAEQVGRMPLRELAEQFGEAWAASTGTPLRATFNAFKAGISSTDFGSAMGTGLREMMLHVFAAMSEHRKITAPLEVRDFRTIDLDFLDIGGTLAPTGENGEIQAQDQGVIIENGGSAQLTSFARTLYISRVVIVNDSWNILQRAFASLGGSSARLENAMVFQALEANPTLGDGEPLFHADLGNVVAGTLDATGLAQAMAALRNQTTPSGQVAGHRAAYLAVSPALEFTAIKLVHEAGLNLEVIASPNIPAARWFLFADPTSAPVVTRLHLPGARDVPFRLEPTRPGDGRDGMALKLTTDLGVSVVSRVGCIRGGTV